MFAREKTMFAKEKRRKEYVMPVDPKSPTRPPAFARNVAKPYHS
jgi:hypothetical protein